MLQRATLHSFLFYDCSTLCIYHIFCNQSVNGHFGFFHKLTIVYNVAMSRYIPRSGIVGSSWYLPFSFWELSILFSTVSVLINIPTNSVQGFLFLHILANAYLIFDDSHSDRCEVISHCDFDLHFWWLRILSLFMCLLHLLPLGKWLFGYSAHFEIVFFGVLMLSYMTCLHMLDIKPLS